MNIHKELKSIEQRSRGARYATSGQRSAVKLRNYIDAKDLELRHRRRCVTVAHLLAMTKTEEAKRAVWYQFKNI